MQLRADTSSVCLSHIESLMENTSKEWLMLQHTHTHAHSHRTYCTNTRACVCWDFLQHHKTTIRWLILLAGLLTLYIYQIVSCLTTELLIKTTASVHPIESLTPPTVVAGTLNDSMSDLKLTKFVGWLIYFNNVTHTQKASLHLINTL